MPLSRTNEDSDILLLDDPTAGLAIGKKIQLFAVITNIASNRTPRSISSRCSTSSRTSRTTPTRRLVTSATTGNRWSRSLRVAPDPDILLLDEPVQGLAVEFVEKVEDEQEAIEKVNDTRFGSAANLWTEDRERSQRLARDIDAGYVYINKMTNPDPRVPFGGIKNAGYDRELFKSGIKELLNRKTAWTQ